MRPQPSDLAFFWCFLVLVGFCLAVYYVLGWVADTFF